MPRVQIAKATTNRQPARVSFERHHPLRAQAGRPRAVAAHDAREGVAVVAFADGPKERHRRTGVPAGARLPRSRVAAHRYSCSTRREEARRTAWTTAVSYRTGKSRCPSITVHESDLDEQRDRRFVFSAAHVPPRLVFGGSVRPERTRWLAIKLRGGTLPPDFRPRLTRSSMASRRAAEAAEAVLVMTPTTAEQNRINILTVYWTEGVFATGAVCSA